MKLLFLPRPSADWDKVFEEGVNIFIEMSCFPIVRMSSPRATTAFRPLLSALNSASWPPLEVFNCWKLEDDLVS